MYIYIYISHHLGSRGKSSGFNTSVTTVGEWVLSSIAIHYLKLLPSSCPYLSRFAHVVVTVCNRWCKRFNTRHWGWGHIFSQQLCQSVNHHLCFPSFNSSYHLSLQVTFIYILITHTSHNTCCSDCWTVQPHPTPPPPPVPPYCRCSSQLILHLREVRHWPRVKGSRIRTYYTEPGCSFLEDFLEHYWDGGSIRK